MEIRALTGASLDTLLAAFNEAFIDYAVKLTMTREDLERMLTRQDGPGTVKILGMLLPPEVRFRHEDRQH